MPERSANPLVAIEIASRRGDGAATGAAVRALESGAILYMPDCGFACEFDEIRLVADALPLTRAKNVSFDPATGRIDGLSGRSVEAAEVGTALRGLLLRYGRFAAELCRLSLGAYGERMTFGRASFRPVEIATRPIRGIVTDDRLLHVDSFPSRPTAGRRILRVFTNVHPQGRPRVWNVGESFPEVARRFVPRLRKPRPAVATLLKALRVTATRRTAYDHYMLCLHDAMKRDAEYQRTVPRTRVELAAGASWVCFSDQVSHAALSGRHVLEQTLHCEVDQMMRPEVSPLRILEALIGRRLA